jgi:predicted RNA binding protein YcfA (HicA-like mRNA interferase family)
MGAKLPVVSGEQIIKVLCKYGYFVHHQRGSHVTLKKDGTPATRVIVPFHDPVRKGTLKSILFDAGLTTEEFVQLLHNQ